MARYRDEFRSFKVFCKENKKFAITSVIAVAGLFVSVITLFVSNAIEFKNSLTVNYKNLSDMPQSMTISSSDKKIYDGITYEGKVYIPIEKLNEYTNGTLIADPGGKSFTVNTTQGINSSKNVLSSENSSQSIDTNGDLITSSEWTKLQDLKVASSGKVVEKWTKTPSTMMAYDGQEYDNAISVGIETYHTIDNRYKIYTTNKQYSRLKGKLIIGKDSECHPNFKGKIAIIDAKLKEDGTFSKTSLYGTSFNITSQPIEIDLDISNCEFIEVAMFFEDGEKYDSMICGLVDFSVM